LKFGKIHLFREKKTGCKSYDFSLLGTTTTRFIPGFDLGRCFEIFFYKIGATAKVYVLSEKIIYFHTNIFVQFYCKKIGSVSHSGKNLLDPYPANPKIPVMNRDLQV